MAATNSFVDVNLNKQQLLAAKLYPLTTAQRTALTLLSGDSGLVVWDLTLNQLYAWNGTAWQSTAPTTGAMSFKGVVAASAAAPASPAVGDFYVFNSAGATTWTPSGNVTSGDSAVFDGTNWNYIEGNDSVATVATLGLVQIASQANVNSGTGNNTVVTPASLAAFVPVAATPLRITRRFAGVFSLVAGTASTISHGLQLNNKEDYVLKVFQGGSSILLADSPVDTNSLNVTSNVALSGVTVVVEG